jgi:uncharacterized OB-fold protein
MGGKPQTDDRFKHFGTVGFTATSKVNDFIDHLASGRVSGTRCKACGQTFFPPRADCCQCLSSDMDWFDVEGSGRLVSFSRLNFAPMGFEKDVPYCIALLDYGSYKVFGRIAQDVPPEDIKVGMAMQAVVNPLPDGQYNYVFKPA